MMPEKNTATPLHLAQQYMDAFYGNAPLATMRPLLADNLEFIGPFLHCHGADAYYQALIDDPPQQATYNIVQVYQQDESVCLIYEFAKAGIQTLMAQTFEVEGGKIVRMCLIFDTRASNSK